MQSAANNHGNDSLASPHSINNNSINSVYLSPRLEEISNNTNSDQSLNSPSYTEFRNNIGSGFRSSGASFSGSSDSSYRSLSRNGNTPRRNSSTEEQQRLFTYMPSDIAGTVLGPNNTIENAGVGPYELQDPIWVKMSAVAPAGESKKRKKCGTKPQAQINKCNNEKRRREQENIYIEELAELISASFADMSSLSVKPDKCAILQETVNQIRRIREQEHHSRGRGTPQQQAQSQQPVAAVQQGEVSSSRPTNILASADFAPFLLDALEGFLIIVSRDGRIEQCSPNIERYIRYTYDEVIHQDLFNIIHVGDTARFSAVLKPPLSVGCWGVATGEEEEGSGGIVPVGTGAHNNRSFNCRFLVKPPDDRDASLDERQQRVEKYEQMHVCSAEVLYPPNDENAEQCLMCIVRRIPHTERASTLAGISGLGTTLSRDQFSTKIDTEGNILVIDTSAVSPRYLPYINKGLEGNLITELCPPSEVQVVKTHMKKALQLKDGATLSTVFDLQVPSAPNKYLNIQTTSRLFSIDQIDYIMSTHFIIGISETDDTKDRHSPSADPLSAGATSATNTAPSTPVGGPLMTSVMNGAPSGATPPRNSSSFSSGASSVAHTLNSTTSASYSMFTGTELELECFFPTPSWDVEPTWGDPTPASNSRPSSQHSAAVTPVSTPTPRGPGASPCGPQQSPLQPYSNQPQQSPASVNQNPSTPSNNYSGGYTFSPLNDPSPYKLEEPSAPVKENNVDDSMNDSGRLRILLMKPNDDSRNKHQILKNLLNQDDEDESKNDVKMSPRGGSLISGLNMPSHSQSSEQPKVSSSGGNDMLLKLLNEKNEDDDLEARAGLKKQSELLQQLLKEQDEELKPQQQHIDTSSQEDQLLRNLGFTSSPSPPGSRKRPHSGDGSDDHTNKRSSGDVTSSGSGSRLSEKNKMLASLLAKQPSSTPIPTLPARVITATPQELPRVGEARKHGFVFHKDVYSTTSASQTNTSSSVSMHNVQTKRVGPGRPSTSSGTAYLNQILSGSNANTNNAMRNMDQFNSNDMNSSNSNAGTSNSNNANYGADNADPILSDILDQVIDIVPDSSATAIINILDTIESTQHMQNNYNSNQQTQNQAAAAAIKAIQNSLMQCEDAVKSPSSPQQSVMSLPPGTPPAYSASVSQNFPPPPGYPQRSVNAANVQRFASARAAYGGNANSSLITTQILHQQQRAKLLQQQEHKRRLLQQQQQQHMLIPQNATAGTEATASALQNMDSLLNNTVAPNVSLQRSTSAPDSQSQLSNAGYATAMSPAGQRLGQVQQPYSPSYSVQSQQYQGNQATRLSPHPPQRQTSYQGPGGTPPVSGAQQQAQWQTQQQNRIGLPQQQNPMLNAQLAGSGYQNRQFSVQRPGNVTAPQRSAAPTMVGSPVSAARQSPFQTDVVYSSAGGGQSPTQAAPQYTAYQHVQQRLQRTLSAPPQQPPTATTHLPGGLCSPSQRGYGPPHHHMHQLPPTYPSSNNNAAGSLYGDVPQYCYDQTGLQLAYNGADRGRAPPQQPPPPPSHMQGGASSNTMTSTSEYVRQELRAVVGARTGQQQQQSQQQQGAAQSGVQQQTQQQATQQRTQQQSSSGNGGGPSASQLSIHQVSSAELEALGLSFEMPNSGASDSPKLWGAMGSNDLGSVSPQAAAAALSSSSRNSMEEAVRPGDQKSSLLQKLLSE